MAGPGGTFNKGRLILIWLGLSVFVIGSWLVVKSNSAPEPEPVPMVRPEPQLPEQPIAFYLARGDAARGERFFARCAACHSIATGAPHSIGPNLVGVMGAPVASRPDFETYSAVLSARGGRWDWETTSRFLRSPRDFLPGTRMVFAGIRDPQDRADVMLYLNRQGGSLPWPAGAR